ncbi:MAG: sugar ABC transporter substrate-binding protein [Candidatus Atribacteria bacterium]|nr:sugar ABC transporter substrate-binding protein [Candidatus Atribacteria bacterium]
MGKNIFRSLLLGLVMVLAIQLVALAADNQFSGVQITVQMQDHSATRAIQKLLPDFEKMTGMKVNLVILPFSAMKEKQLIELASRNATYDVIMLDYRDVAGYGEARWMIDLGQYIKGPLADPNLKLDDFLPTGVQSLTWKNKLYGFPFYIESTMLMYRKDLYDANALKVPENWDELYANALKLNLDTNKDGQVDFYGCTLRGLRAVGYNDYIYNGFLKSFGGSYFDDKWKPIFNNENGMKALETYIKILKDCGPPSVATFGYEEVMQEMMQNKTAQVIDATMLGTWLEDPEKSQVAGKNGYAMVPKGTVQRGNSFFGMGLGIPVFSKNPDAAYKFIEWATSEQVEKSFINEGAFMTRSSVLNTKEFKERWPLFANLIIDSLADANITYTPILPEWREVADFVSIAVSTALIGEKTPKEALDNAAAEVEKVMKKAGYY